MLIWLLSFSLFCMIGRTFPEPQQLSRRGFRCGNGQRVDWSKVCDGEIDCEDDSDEHERNCKGIVCPPDSFKCEYGACMPRNVECNGKYECYDGSDEFNCTVTGSGKWSCEDRRTIDVTRKCDGRIDCSDGSDETEIACGDTECRDSMFRCVYGACIPGQYRCNGIAECRDGSDESDDVCNPRTDQVEQPDPSCVLPETFINGAFSFENGTVLEPGERISNQVGIFIRCSENYTLTPNISQNYCFSSYWFQGWPACVRQGPSLFSGGSQQSTTARSNISCTDGETISEPCGSITYRDVCENGQWKYGFESCHEPRECGKKVKFLLFATGGRDTSIVNYPWLVSIHLKQDANRYQQICAGTIVSTRLIISAAHCFADDAGQIQPLSNYIVYADSTQRNYDATRGQTRNLVDIKLPGIYKGIKTNYMNDIAAVVVDKHFDFRDVNSICVTNIPVPLDGIGKFAGWGYTESDGKPSETLLEVDLPFRTESDCIDTTPEHFWPFITFDKFCAGNTNGTALCRGDSGGSIIYYYNESNYFIGVASVGVLKHGTCDINQYSAFTRISFFRPWILQLMDIY